MDVTVLDVDEKKGRISLTMLDGSARSERGAKGERSTKQKDKPSHNKNNNKKNDTPGMGTMAEALSKLNL